MKRLSLLVAILLALSAFSGCTQKQEGKGPTGENNGIEAPEEAENSEQEIGEERGNSDESKNGENPSEESPSDEKHSNGEETSDEKSPENEDPSDHGKTQDQEKGQSNKDQTITDNIKVVNVDGQLKVDKKYFNVIKTIDDKKTIQNPDNLLVMVNKEFFLPSTYVPKNLVKPNVPFSYSSAEENYLQKIAADALENMFSAAKKDGIQLIGLSGYRSYQTQKALFQRYVNQMGFEQASKISAQAGTSEHQTGLTMDITANSVNQQLVERFETTAEGKWLRENAHKYGFILRYPKGKENITGYSYEPWHFRYVGREVAKIIYENNWTLEEFFQVVREL